MAMTVTGMPALVGVAAVVTLAWVAAGARPSAAVQSHASKTIASGSWGGTGASAEVDGKRVAFEFDCAHGEVEGRIVIDDAGRFEAKGRFVRERGGPMREGDAPAGESARYAGTVEGTTLTLTVYLAGDEKAGPYTLALGRAARLRKCL